MIFEITEDMQQKIKKWDSCNPVDVTGLLSYLKYFFLQYPLLIHKPLW